MTPAVLRVLWSTLAVALVFVAGGVAIWAVGGGRWDLGDSIYMSIISAATVGFGELPEMEKAAGAHAVVVVVILLGISTFAFLQSSLTALFVESAIGEAFRRRRMERTIEELEGHVVVAGVGSTGMHAVEELVATRTPFIAIDRDRAHLERVAREIVKGDMLFVVGEATEDHTLAHAGVSRASGVIAALSADRDNLYVTLSARSMNAKARIISKVVELEAIPKMLRAGANLTVSPNTIGGRRMAAELLRPVTTEFLDQMLRERGGMRFTEVTLPAASPFVGKTLRDVPIREQTGTLVIAVREPGSMETLYNPVASQVLRAGATLVLLADTAGIEKLRRLAGAG